MPTLRGTARGLTSTPHPNGLAHTDGEAAGGPESTTQGEDTDTVPGKHLQRALNREASRHRPPVRAHPL